MLSSGSSNSNSSSNGSSRLEVHLGTMITRTILVSQAIPWCGSLLGV
jgi:hypothetical protein